MGYIAPQSCLELGNQMIAVASPRKNTDSIACCSAIQDRAARAYMLSPDVLKRHLALHQFLVRPKVRAVTNCLAQESDALTLINTSDTILGTYLLDSVERAAIHGIRVRLYLQP